MNFVFDVDGTLCFDGQSIAPSIINALEQLEAKGHQVIFASARPIRDLLPVVPEFSRNLLIGGNGSIISEEEKITVINFIPAEAYQAVIHLIEKFDLTYVIDGPFNYGTNVTEEHQIFRQLDPAQLAVKLPYPEIEEAIKIILVDLKPALFATVERSLAELKDTIAVISHKNENSLDITAKGINKFTTLSKQRVTPYIAFGNDSNDVALLSHGLKRYFVGDQQLAKELGLDKVNFLPKDPEKIAMVIGELGEVADD